MGYTGEFVTGAIIAGIGYGLTEYVEPVVASIISGAPAPFDYAAIVSLGGLLFMGIGGLLMLHAIGGGLLTYLKTDEQPAPAAGQEQRQQAARTERAPRAAEQPQQERPQRGPAPSEPNRPPRDDHERR